MRNSLFSALPPRIAAAVFPAACAALVCASVAIHAAVATSAPATAADASDHPVVSVQTVRVQQGAIAQPVRAFGIVAASASNLTTINLPYLARIVQLRVQSGQSVTRGTPLFVVQADPAAVLAAAQAKSAVTLAQGELTRTQSLLASARKALNDAQQALAAQNETGIASGNKLVTAPTDGVVMQLSAAQGDQVPAGAAILQLAGGTGHGLRDQRANVMLGVEPSAAGTIHPGDVVTLRGLSTALARSTVNGHVTLVGAAINQQSQLVDVGADVPLGQTPFIPGTRVSADIATRTGTHWIVPRAAVLRDDHGAYVFQITPKNTARRVAVLTQIENGDRYGVDGAIDSTEPLVVSGNYELKDGMAVRTSGGAPR
jgi:RND family efflux transporter MFP subunit